MVVLGAITEIVGYYAVNKYGTNLRVYDIATLIETLLIIFYFHYSVTVLKKYAIGFYGAGITVLWWAVCFFKLNTEDSVNMYFLWFQCLLVTVCTLIAQYNFQRIPEVIKMARKIHFWIPLILLFGQLGGILGWTAYKRVAVEPEVQHLILHTLLLLVGNATLIFLSIIFFRLPKMKTTHG